MIRPMPRQQPSRLPSARRFPDPQHIEDLSRLGDEITEMAAHLAAGTCQLLELIAIFDEEGGWQNPFHSTGHPARPEAQRRWLPLPRL